MRQITVYIDDGIDWFDGKELAKMIDARFNRPSTTPVIVESNHEEIKVTLEKVFSDIAIMGDRYEHLKKLAKKRGITVEQLLERGMNVL